MRDKVEHWFVEIISWSPWLVAALLGLMALSWIFSGALKILAKPIFRTPMERVLRKIMTPARIMGRILSRRGWFPRYTYSPKRLEMWT